MTWRTLRQQKVIRGINWNHICICADTWLFNVVYVFYIHTNVEICLDFTYSTNLLLAGGVLQDLQESAHVVPARCLPPAFPFQPTGRIFAFRSLIG